MTETPLLGGSCGCIMIDVTDATGCPGGFSLALQADAETCTYSCTVVSLALGKLLQLTSFSSELFNIDFKNGIQLDNHLFC